MAPFNHPSQYTRIDTAACVGIVHREWADQFSAPEAFILSLEHNPGRVLRGGAGKGRTSVLEISGKQVYVKQYGPGRLGWRLREGLLGRMCFREWKCNCRAATAGIESAGVLAVLSERGIRSGRRVVVTSGADGVCVKDTVLAIEAGPARDALVTRLGEFVARMHNAGLYHPNLHWKHIFVESENRFTLIDMDRAILCRPLPERLAGRNVRRLAANLEQGLGREAAERFLGAYAGARNTEPAQGTSRALMRLRQGWALLVARVEHFFPAFPAGPRCAG